MKKQQAKREDIQKILIALIGKPEGTTISFWKIRDTIEASGLAVKNWMMVRGEMQKLINGGVLRRTRDLEDEVYDILFS